MLIGGKKAGDLAEAYIRKIYHETMQISVVKRLERYLKIGGVDDSKPKKNGKKKGRKDVSDDETLPADEYSSDEGSTANEEDSSEPLWADECKRLFLCYYDHYTVPSSH